VSQPWGDPDPVAAHEALMSVDNGLGSKDRGQTQSASVAALTGRGRGQRECIAPPQIVPVVHMERESEHVGPAGQLAQILIRGWARAAAFGSVELYDGRPCRR